MLLMCVQRQHEGGAFQNDSDTGVVMAVNPPFMSLGLAEEAFQVEIVLGQIRVAAREQPLLETGHDLGHVLVHRIQFRREGLLQAVELLLSLLRRTITGRQRLLYLLDVADIATDLFLDRFDRGKSPADVAREPCDLVLCRPPFFAARFRCKDSLTSFKAAAIRRPGGCSGPPWSSLRIPRTAAQ